MPRRKQSVNATPIGPTILSGVERIISLLNGRLICLSVNHDCDDWVRYDAYVDGCDGVDVGPLVDAGLSQITSNGLYFAFDGGQLWIYWERL